MQFEIPSLRLLNDCSDADTDIFEPWNAFFSFHGAPGVRFILLSPLVEIMPKAPVFKLQPGHEPCVAR